MRRRLFPLWKDRPSLLSAWVETVGGSNQSGSFITNLGYQQNNIAMADTPPIVVKACRLTRWAVLFTYNASSGGAPTVTLNIQRGSACAVPSTAAQIIFSPANGAFLYNCFTGRFDPNMQFDAGDTWKVTNALAPSLSFPALRLTFFWEAR